MDRPLRDADIRDAAKRSLFVRANRCPETLVIDELGIEHGSSRVDIAVINGHIRGVEIKAEADNLDRLPRQVESYGRVVDKATLIVAESHVEAALNLLPEWWGVILVKKCANGKLAFRRIRHDRINGDVEATALARLLWRSEALALLHVYGRTEKSLSGARREALYVELAKTLSKRALRHAVRSTLKARKNWRDRGSL